MARPRVLLTGFGPFPGVADNPSGRLAETLSARTSGPDWECRSAVLPTEWEAVSALAPRLYADLQPLVMIHFGVSARCQALHVERWAHNGAAPRADARGATPASPLIAVEGAARLETRLPVKTLAAHLRAHGHTARVSQSCGRYLCNFLYYQALDWARAQRQAPLVLFVHIPPVSGRFSKAVLRRGGEEILRFVLNHAKARGAPCPSPFPPCGLHELAPHKIAAESPFPQGERESGVPSSKMEGA